MFSHASFVYDGDGKRVKSAITTNVGTTTTYFVGMHYEVSNGVVTKYYYAGSQRVAMRVGGSVYYLLSDHLGSTGLTTDSSGVVVSEMRYSAWGEVRYASGNTPTKYQYTGQFSHAAEFGLLFYNARWYDPALARFTSADTDVPASQGVQGYDRYAYSNNNPVRYTDPTGHWIESALDVAFIAYDIYDISSNGLNWENGLSLAADVVGLALPVVTGGGMAVRALTHADDAVKVINTADNVIDAANAIDAGNAADNLTDIVKAVDDIPCSFSAETDVTTLEGAKDIAAIKIGDSVLAWNEADGTLGYYAVTDVLIHADQVLTELIIDGERIETTPQHPFYVEGKGWTPAEDLQWGDEIRQADGTIGTIWLTWTVYRTQTMYNLTVDAAHTFFVGEGQWLVHNTCPVKFDPRQLQQKFKHATDFGVYENWSKTGAEKFQAALEQHIADPNTILIPGTYRNTIQVTHYFNPKTYLNIIANDFDQFISGWRLSQRQFEELMLRHNIR